MFRKKVKEGWVFIGFGGKAVIFHRRSGIPGIYGVSYLTGTTAS